MNPVDEYQRDQLWITSFETYYECYYEEIVSDSLVDRWQYVDDTSKVLIAITASGSAVSGWALWNQPYFQTFWVILAGFTAILAIIHVALGVPDRLREWGDIKRYFVSLRVDLETYRYRMQIDPHFSVQAFTDEFIDYRRRYGEGQQKLRNDLLLTNHLRITAQNKVSIRLADLIEHE